MIFSAMNFHLMHNVLPHLSNFLPMSLFPGVHYGISVVQKLQLYLHILIAFRDLKNLSRQSKLQVRMFYVLYTILSTSRQRV